MSDFTIDDTMARIIYEVTDREIYNDIRSEVQVATTDTIVDDSGAPAGYSWQTLTKASIGLFDPLQEADYTMSAYATHLPALAWRISYQAFFEKVDGNYVPGYTDYDIAITSSGAASCVVRVRNTSATKYMAGGFHVEYKWKSEDAVPPSTHDEIVYNMLMVRAKDDTSIAKYGRRVMNLMWPQETSEADMQMLVESYLAKYKDPLPKLSVTIQGKNDTLATQIFTREISDTITVTCTELGMTTVDFYIDAITITDSQVAIPICEWRLIQQSAREAAGTFLIDTDNIDGPAWIA